MNVIVHLQISSYDRLRKALVCSDSNLVAAQTQVAATLTSHTGPYQVVLCGPGNIHPDEKQEAIVRLVDGVPDLQLAEWRYFDLEHGVSAEVDRQDRPLGKMVRLLHELDPGAVEHVVVWVNDPAKVPLWRTAARVAGVRVVLLTYVSWWWSQSPTAEKYRAEQELGAAEADAVFVNSWALAQRIHRARPLRLLPWSALKAEEERKLEPVKRASNYVWVVWNHRLSSDPYYAVPRGLFLGALALAAPRVSAVGKMLGVLFTNPSGKVVPDDVREFSRELDRVDIHADFSPLSYIEYLRRLKAADLVVSVTSEAAAWNLAVLDALAVGTPVALNVAGGVTEMFPFTSPLVHPTTGELIAELPRLIVSLAEAEHDAAPGWRRWGDYESKALHELAGVYALHNAELVYDAVLEATTTVRKARS